MFNLIGKEFYFDNKEDILVWYDFPRLFIQNFNNVDYLFSEEFSSGDNDNYIVWYRLLVLKNKKEFIKKDINEIADIIRNKNKNIFSVSDGIKILNILESTIENPYD